MDKIHKGQKLLVTELSIQFPFGQWQILFLLCLPSPVALPQELGEMLFTFSSTTIGI